MCVQFYVFGTDTINAWQVHHITYGKPFDIWLKIHPSARTISYCFTNPPTTFFTPYSSIDNSADYVVSVVMFQAGSWVELVEAIDDVPE